MAASGSRPPVELSRRHRTLPRGLVGGGSGGSSRGSMTEFLVEVTPGRELRYRSSLSFRLAIRSSEIPPEARIFHRARRTWLPITAHPVYRRIQSEQSAPHWLQPALTADAEDGDVPAPPGEQPSLRRRVASGWTFLKAIARKRRTAPHSTSGAEAAETSDNPAAEPEQAGTSETPQSESASTVTSEPSASQRRQWTFYS